MSFNEGVELIKTLDDIKRLIEEAVVCKSDPVTWIRELHTQVYSFCENVTEMCDKEE